MQEKFINGEKYYYAKDVDKKNLKRRDNEVIIGLIAFFTLIFFFKPISAQSETTIMLKTMSCMLLTIFFLFMYYYSRIFKDEE